MKLKLELGGGIESLFSNSTSLLIEGDMPTIKELFALIRANYLKDKSNALFADSTLKPGILVLINETDWEITGEASSPLHDGDTVTLYSTLHGG